MRSHHRWALFVMVRVTTDANGPGGSPRPPPVQVVIVGSVGGAAVYPRVRVLEIKEQLVRVTLYPDPDPSAGGRVQATHHHQCHDC